MEKYDLHIHSTFSDGEYSLEEIVKRLRENEIKIFSITDHDNVDSIKAMQKIDINGLLYIPGIEFSASKGKYQMHILGYGVDGNSSELLETCKEIKTRKNLRNLEVIQQLKEKFGIEITREEALELLNRTSFVGQTTIAKLLVEKGTIPSVKFYFDIFFKDLELKTNATVDLDRAVQVIHNSGGVAVIAHPIAIENKYGVQIGEIYEMFRNAGIDGIEIFNSKHTLSDIKKYYKLARQEGLIISGGSDYHGEIMKPNIKLGKIAKDNSEEKEHYCMTVVQEYLERKKKEKIKESEDVEK